MRYYNGLPNSEGTLVLSPSRFALAAEGCHIQISPGTRHLDACRAIKLAMRLEYGQVLMALTAPPIMTEGAEQGLLEQIATLKIKLAKAQEDRDAALRDYAEIEDHNEYLIQTLMVDDIKRIDAMTPEEVEAELAADGWTKERMDAACQKMKAMLHKALEDRAAEALEGFAAMTQRAGDAEAKLHEITADFRDTELVGVASIADAVQKLRQRAQDAEAEASALRKALEGLRVLNRHEELSGLRGDRDLRIAVSFEGDSSDFTLGDLRRAAEALKGQK